MLESSRGGFAEIVAIDSNYGKIVITATQDTLKRYAGENQDQLVETYRKIIKSQDDANGQNEDVGSKSERSDLVYYISEGTFQKSPNAANYRVSWPGSDAAQFLSSAGLQASWGMFHELGHLHQQDWTWGNNFDPSLSNNFSVTEATVNIYSLASQKIYPNTTQSWGSVATWETARKYFDNPSRNFGDASNEAKLVMFAQLGSVYGDRFFPELNTMHRDDSVTFKSDQDKVDFFAQVASKVAQKDLRKFLTEDWRLSISDVADKAIADLGLAEASLDAKSLNPFPEKPFQRDIFIRYVNKSSLPLNAAEQKIVGRNIIIRPSRVNPGETGVIRVATRNNEGLTGSLSLTPDSDTDKVCVNFAWSIPVSNKNSYSVGASSQLKIVTSDDFGNTRTTVGGRPDFFTSDVLGKGNLPINIWVEVIEK